MSRTEAPATGQSGPLDEQQRSSAIAGAIRGTAAVIGAATDLPAVLAAAGIEVIDGASATASATLVVRGPRGAALDAATRDRLVAHVGSGGRAIADIAASDLATRRALEAAASAPLTVLAQADVVGTVLADELDEITPGVELLGDAPIVAGAVASRLLVFAGIEGVEAPARGTAVLFPSPVEEVARLRALVQELELNNRRLAEGRLGVHDAAAARAAAASEAATARREYVRDLEERLDSAVFHARQNDQLFQDARMQLFDAQAQLERLRNPLGFGRAAVRKIRGKLRSR